MASDLANIRYIPHKFRNKLTRKISKDFPRSFFTLSISLLYKRVIPLNFFLPVPFFITYMRKTNNANHILKQSYEAILQNHLFTSHFRSFLLAIFKLFQDMKKEHHISNVMNLNCLKEDGDLMGLILSRHIKERDKSLVIPDFRVIVIGEDDRRMQRLIRSWVGSIGRYNQLLQFQ